MRRREILIVALACGAVMAGVRVKAESADTATDAAHHHMVPGVSVMAPGAAAAPTTNRIMADYTVPNVRLIRQDGTVVNLGDEINDGRPVVLSFIFTSCTAVCPLISHTLSMLQDKLGANRERVHLMSISIDPEQDTPARLRDYAKTFNAGPQWQHYTGSVAASETAQRAFDVYRGAKMDHTPATLIRVAPGQPWVRIIGYATADQLLDELSPVNQLHAAQ